MYPMQTPAARRALKKNWSRSEKRRAGKRILAVEALENRNMLSACGVLQGTVIGPLGPQSGATVTLTGNSIVPQTVVTGASGQYQFSGLAAGQYQLVETPPGGSQAQNVQLLSQVYAATNPGSSPNTVNVTIPNPTGYVVTSANMYNFFTTTANWACLFLTVDGQYTSNGANIGPFPVTVTNSDGSIVSPTQYSTLCYDPLSFLSDYPPGSATNVYDATATCGPAALASDPNSPYTTPLSDGPQIAYLYNQYTTGAYGALSQVNAVALQLAVFELEFDPQTSPYTAASFSSGNFQVNGVAPSSQFFQPSGYDPNVGDYLTAAAAYANSAIAQSASAIFLNPTTIIQGGSQGVLGTNVYNFNNVPTSTGSPPGPAFSTTPSPTSVSLGSTSVTLKDTATLTGGNSPTGSISFTLVGPNNSVLDQETVTNVTDGSYTTPNGFTLPATGAMLGTYQWNATFFGNASNASISEINSPAEQVVVGPATPAVNTTVSGSNVVAGGTPTPSTGMTGSSSSVSVVVGSTIYDTATVAGGYNPTGSVTFNLYSNSNGTGLLYTDANVPLVSGVATSGNYTTTATGTEYWVATYNGDSYNKSVSSGNTAEQVVVQPASPSIATVAGGTVVLGSGAKLNDSATLAGTYSPGGSLTFYLFAPGVAPNAAGTGSVYSDQVQVSANVTTYSTATGSNPGGYLPVVPGTYQWVASYTGDNNNSPASSYPTENEPEVVTYSNVIVTKTTNTPSISAGQMANFTVTITNNGTATATGVTLSDPLPAGLGSDVSWTIVSGMGNPSDFVINGTAPSQSLVLSSAFIAAGDSLAAGQSISVQITATTHADDVSSCCTTQCNISNNFNGTCIPGGDYIWFSCAANVQGLGSSQSTTVSCTGQTISFTCGTHNYSVPVGDCQLTFAPNCTTATTSCNSGTWNTCVPDSGLSGNEFLCGAVFQVPAGGLPGGISNVTWTGNDSSNSACNINCEWAAAVYSSAFASSCSSLNVKPCDDNHASQYKNSDNCGTPENYKNCVVVGACGNGGSPTNWQPGSGTGSYCTPCPVTPPVMTCGTGTLPNTATVTANYQSSNKSSATVQIGFAAPDVTVTKTADATCVTAGQTAGYTVTIANIGMATATGVTLSDPLPAGLSKDIKWSIDTSKGNPADFQITGATGNQSLSLISSVNTLAAGASLTVHITATTNADDVGSASTSQCSISTNFNGTSIPGGDYLWFSCDVNVQGCSSYVPSTIVCSGQTISFTSGGKNYCLPVSDGTITYAPNCSTATTSCDSSDGDWVTCVPESGLACNQFLCGLAFQVPQGGLPGGIQNVCWSGNDTSDNNCTISTQWSAVAYSCFSTQCSLLGVKPCDDNRASEYQNSDSCGTPENYKCYVIGGGCGDGGSNYTGSHSSTCSQQGSSCGLGAGTLNNIATVTASNEASCFQNATAAATIKLTSAVTVCGTKYLDSCGRGYYSNEPVQCGTTINLYENCSSQSWGGQSNCQVLVCSTKTDSNGNYCFSDLLPGVTYCVQEVVPTGYYQECGGSYGVQGNSSYSICAQNGGRYSGNNFCDRSYSYCNADLSSTGLAYTPEQVRAAYGINNISLDGTGQTIAIVDAYDDPAIVQSLDAYDSQFGLTASGPTLYQQYGSASSFLTVLGQNGTTSLPAADPNGPGTSNWEIEEAMDVEWAHAMAPGAKIVLVEANSQSLSDLMAGVVTAANQPGVSVVSMSWGFAEGQSVLAQDEAMYDSDFTTPAGHQGVTFVSSTGDYGTADPEYPAFSPNVVSVGGTSLYLNGDNSYNNETGWGYFSNSAGTLIGSGGGTSLFEPEPTYQQGVQSSGSRSTPDVSFLADPGTGAWIADTYNQAANNAFEVAGGTSLSAPCWGGLFALVNQGRAVAGQATLNSTTPTDAQQALYSLPKADFNSITSGSNGGYTAAAGYNMVTGLGTPVANQLVASLVAYNQSGDVNTTTPVSVTAASSCDAPASTSANVFDALTFTAHASFLPHASSLASAGDAETAEAFLPTVAPSHAARDYGSREGAAPQTAVEDFMPSAFIATADASASAAATVPDRICALDAVFADYGMDDNPAVGVPYDLSLPDAGSVVNDLALQAVLSESDADA